MSWPSGDELRVQVHEKHKGSLSDSAKKFTVPDSEIERRHRAAHMSMAISTPERVKEGKHHA